jgi:hypothetical protein
MLRAWPSRFQGLYVLIGFDVNWIEAQPIRAEIVDALESDKLPHLTLEQLETYHALMSQIRRFAMGRGQSGDGEKYFLGILNQAIATKRAEAQAERHHGEAMGQGKQTLDASTQTLCWTKIAAVAAILGVIVTVILVILQIWLSNTGTSTVDRALPTSSPQTTATISESPARAATTSTATPLPKPTVERSPTPVPQ